MKTFDELWNACETFHQQISPDASISNIIDGLLMKISLYQAIDARHEIPEEERQQAKSRAMGEILLTLTHLSLKDNLNVFEALAIALRYRNAEFFEQKYQTI